MRDFILRIEIACDEVPTISFIGAGSEEMNFESEDEAWCVLEPGLNIVSFTETKRS